MHTEKYNENKELNEVKIEAITSTDQLTAKDQLYNCIISRLKDKETIIRLIINGMCKSHSIDQILETIVTNIGELLCADRCLLGLFNQKQSEFSLKSEYKISDKTPTAINSKILDNLPSNWHTCLIQEKMPIIINGKEDSLSNKNEKEYLKLHDIKSLAITPILCKQEVLGIIIAHQLENDKEFETAHIDILKDIGDQLALAIRHSEHYSITKRQAERELLLRNIISTIRSTMDMHEIKSIVITEIGKFFNTNRCLLHELDSISKKPMPIDFEYLSNSKEKSIKKEDSEHEKIKYWTKITFIEQNEAIITDTETYIKQQNLEDTSIAGLLNEYNIKALIGIPILYADEVMGTLVLHFDKKIEKPNDEDMKFIRTLADQLGTALFQTKLHETTKKQANREHLLRKIFITIRSTLDIDEVLKTICEEIAVLFNVERVMITNYPDIKDYKNWTVKSEYKIHKRIAGISKIGNDKRILEFWGTKVFNNESTYVVNNLSETDAPDYIKESYQKLGVKSLLAIPIKNGNNTCGLLSLSQYSYFRHWQKEEIKLLESISDQIYLAISQAEMYSAIKKQLEKEKQIRSDNSILINRNLASHLGLNCAITYSTLLSLHNYHKDEGKLTKDGELINKIAELKKYTYLSDTEQTNAIQKLFETGLIEYKKTQCNSLCFKITEDESLIKQYLSTSKTHKKEEKLIKEENTPKTFCNITELCEIYSKYYSICAVNSVKYFLKKSGQIRFEKNQKISRLYFSVICRTLHDFTNQYLLNLEGINAVIDEWFDKKPSEHNNCVVSFGLTNRILVHRLQKILFYRLQEAKVLATDFCSIMDFYSDLEFNAKDNELIDP